MDDYRRNLIQVSGAILALFLLGTLGYYFLEEDWSLFDAFYMVVISITTVGYGEIHQLSTAGRVLSIILIFLGLGVAASFATQIVRLIIEGELKGLYGRRKMEKKIKQISNHYIVCGHGRTGGTICLKLHERGIPFVVIEADSKNGELAGQRGYPIVNGDAKSDQCLINAGIQRASGIVAIIPDDSTALLISMAARELNPAINIIVQGSDPKIEKRLHRAGADKVVYPLSLGGEQIARLIAQKQKVPIGDYEESFDWDVHGFYLKVFKHCDEAPLSIQTILSRTNAVSAVSHITHGQISTNNPSPQTSINNGDSLILVMLKSTESPHLT